MSNLNTYLEKYFLTTQQLSVACNISTNELEALIEANLVPQPSYIVTKASGKSATITSFVFGEMSAPEANAGEYFHRDSPVWVNRAIAMISSHGRAATYDILKNNFIDQFAEALKELNVSIWRLADSFDENGAVINEGLRLRCATAWKYFLNGTFNLCVAQPVSEAEIAKKEILQEKLSALSENGQKTDFTSGEKKMIVKLIADYANAAMPFSPVEYAISSRKRLVDDLTARLSASASD